MMSHSAIKAGKWEERRVLIMKMSVFPNHYPTYGGPASKMWLNIARWWEAENNCFISHCFCVATVQLSSEYLQGWIFHSLSGKPAPAFYYPFTEKHIFIESKSPMFQLRSFTTCSMRIVWLFFSVPQRLSHCRHQKGLPGVFLFVGWTNSVLSVSPHISLSPWIWSYALWPY